MLTCNSDGDLMLVVDLVNMLVEKARMEHTMAEVECQVFHEHAEEDLATHLARARQSLHRIIKLDW